MRSTGMTDSSDLCACEMVISSTADVLIEEKKQVRLDPALYC